VSIPPELRPLSPAKVTVFFVAVMGAAWVGDTIAGPVVPTLIGAAFLYATIRSFVGRR